MSVNIQDLENTEEAQDQFNQVVTQRKRRKRRQVDVEEARDHAETGEDPDVVTLEIDGEEIPMEPIGLGRRARISRDAMRADERGDNLAAMEAVVDMVDALIDNSPSRFDQSFWDGLSEAEIQSAFQSYGQKSAGGNER